MKAKNSMSIEPYKIVRKNHETNHPIKKIISTIQEGEAFIFPVEDYRMVAHFARKRAEENTSFAWKTQALPEDDNTYREFFCLGC